MDNGILTALIEGQLSIIRAQRQAEVDARLIVDGASIRDVIKKLFPGVGDELLDSCGDVVNHLGLAVGRYVRALARGQNNWEWEGGDTVPTSGDPGGWLNPISVSMRQTLTTDALVTGKIALFPAVVNGRLKVSALNGFLYPIFEEGDSSEIAALLQVNSNVTSKGVRYEVRRYLPGLLEVFSDLEDWTAYTKATPTPWPQAHARDRLPVAVRIVHRDTDRRPLGMVQAAMPAFRRYIKNAVLLAFIAHRGGFEERVAYSDKLMDLAEKNPKDPLLNALREVGTNKVRLVGSGDKYERLAPVALQEYRNVERDAAADVQDAMNMPDTGGADLSGEALAEKREAYTETTDSLAANIADVETEVHELVSVLRPGEFRLGYRITLKPKFSRDVDAERAAIREDYKTGGVPQSAFLSELQSLGVSAITDDLIERARRMEELDAPIETTA